MTRKWKVAAIGLFATACLAPAGAQVITDVQPAPDIQPVRVIRPLAAPRLAAATVPLNPQVDSVDLADRCCRTVGAVYNFAHRNGRLIVRPGQPVVFTVPEISGTWYERACAFLAVYVQVDVLDQSTGRMERLGSWFRHASGCGPKYASASDIAVALLRERPGTYLVTARITTWAIPLTPNREFSSALYRCADIATDIVQTKVRVVEFPTPTDIAWVDAQPVDLSEDDWVVEFDVGDQ